MGAWIKSLRHACLPRNAELIVSPDISLPEGLAFNERMKMDGIGFLSKIPKASVPVAFFDPQYSGVLDKLGYGNEGEKRGQRQCNEAMRVGYEHCKARSLRPPTFGWRKRIGKTIPQEAG